MKHFCTTVCAAVLGTVFLGFAAANAANLFFNGNKPEISESENRALAKLPEFTAEAFLNGSYTSGLDKYLSDNFIQRENFIKLSKTLSSYKSINTLLNIEQDVVYIPVSGGTVGDELPDEEPDTPQPPSSQDEPEESPGKEPETSTDPEDSQGSGGEQTPDAPSDDPSLSEDPGKQENPGTTGEPSQPEDPSQPEKPGETNPGTQPSQGQDESANPNKEEPEETVPEGEPDYTVSGYIIYNNAVYSIAYLVKSNAEYYAKMLDYYASVFPDAQISCLVAPLSAVTLTGTKMEKKINAPEKLINTIYSYFPDNDVNCVNVCGTMVEHKSEYLYYRSDHHWTDRGAYYAYSDFIQSIGLEPTPLADFEEKLLTNSYHGTMYSMTGSEKVRDFSDSVYAYIPTKKQTMTIYPTSGSPYSYDSSIITSSKNYSAFIDGDNPFTVISTPDSPQDRGIVVIKDSYGNAVCPYLTENFGTVIVVDPRHYKGDLTVDLKGYTVTDILFLNDAYNPSVKSWTRKIGNLVP